MTPVIAVSKKKFLLTANYQFMITDMQLQNDVMEEIKWDPMLSAIAPHIGVTVKDGIITLSGQVESFLQKHALESAVKRLRGVTYVAMDVEVSIGTKRKIHDSDIAASIREAFRQLSFIDDEAIEVSVDDGFVTLQGNVKWNYQRAAAEERVKMIDGVTGINNLMVLSNDSTDGKNIMEKINYAFHRLASVDASNIRVQVKGTKAVLSGTVRSWVEKKDAENTVWSAPGIRSIENNITIEHPFVH